MKPNHSSTGVLDISPIGKDVSLIDFAPENSCRNLGFIPHRPGVIVMDNGRLQTPFGRSRLYSSTTTNNSYGNWFCRGNEYSKTPLRADMMTFVNNGNKDVYSYGKHGGESLNGECNLSSDSHNFISNFALNSGRTPIKGMLSSHTFPPYTAGFRRTNYQQPFNLPHHKPLEGRQCSSPNTPKTTQTVLCPPTPFSRKNVQIQSDVDSSTHSFQKRDVPTRSKQLNFAKDVSVNSLPNVEHGADQQVQRRKINLPSTHAQQKLHHLHQQQSSAQETPINGYNTTSHHLADLIHASANLQSTIEKSKSLTQAHSNILPCQQLQLKPKVEAHLDGPKTATGNRFGVITNAPLIPRRNGRPINAFMVQPQRKNIYDSRSPSSCSSPSSEHLRNQYQLSARQNTTKMQFPEFQEFRQHLEGNAPSNSPPPEVAQKCEPSFKPTNPDSTDTPKQTTCLVNTPKRSILKNSSSNSRYCENPCSWGTHPSTAHRRQSFSDISFFRYHNHPNMNQSRFQPPNLMSDATNRMCGGDPYRNCYNQLPLQKQFFQDEQNTNEQRCPSKTILNRKKVSFML